MVTYNVNLEGKTILVTGAAGFIGSNLVKRLFKDVKNIHVIGIDNVSDYYDVNIKYERLKEIEDMLKDGRCGQQTWEFVKGNIADKVAIDKLFEEHQFSVVVNLAAQAGVRYSITNPDAYIESNLIGFYNILEACRHHEVEHLVYASSSSVYGSNKKIPYSTDDKVDNPVSLYAATKKSNELLAHAYSKLYNIPSTGLRFFTVYGPAGRPDMAYFGFTNKLREGKTIQIFNFGNCKRDFTYVDDIVEGVVRIMQHAPEKAVGDDGLPIPPYKVYNIGNNSPENLLDFVTILQEELIRAKVLPEDYDFESHKELVPMQPGDVPITYADTTPLEQDFGYKPSTSLRSGLRSFAEWYAKYYGTLE
jgi:nucleoside-diphosphate-sugar epimerase